MQGLCHMHMMYTNYVYILFFVKFTYQYISQLVVTKRLRDAFNRFEELIFKQIICDS